MNRSVAFSLAALFSVAAFSQKVSTERCEFDPSDPKGDLFLMKEFDAWSRRTGSGVFISDYRMKPLLKTDRKTGERIGNFDRVKESHSSEILDVLVPFYSSAQLASTPERLEKLREYARGPEGLAEDIDSIPCSPNQIRVCAVAEPYTARATGEEWDKYSDKELNKLFRRFRSMRIEHCLSNETLPEKDRETIRKACEEPPPDTTRDRGYPTNSLQFRLCGAAIRKYLKDSRGVVLEKGQKYVPKHK